MKVLLLGANGGMGKRYQAILKYLRVAYAACDIGDSVTSSAVDCDRAIITTPTDAHWGSILNAIEAIRGPILCEKPVLKDTEKLAQLLATKPNLQMVCQYRHLANQGREGRDSHYNYFKTGNDGLNWDCMQIIGLSTGKCTIKNDSHIWDCKINGQTLHIQDMDWAYEKEISSWLINPSSCIHGEQMLSFHEKAKNFK